MIQELYSSGVNVTGIVDPYGVSMCVAIQHSV